MKPLCVSLALALAACGSKPSSTSAPTTPPATGAFTTAGASDDDPSCPLLVPGTSLSVDNYEMGAALVFVTTGDPLAVRARAARLADMYAKQDGPPDALGMMFSKGVMTAEATEIDGGARVSFSAIQRDAVRAVQDELKMHASHLSGGTCKM